MKEPASNAMKDFWINKVLEKRFDTTDPVEEIIYDPFSGNMELKMAILLIQKTERGRQGKNRYLDMLNQINGERRQLENRKRMHGGKM